MHLVNELHALLDRLRAEYEMTYIEVVGCLELVKADVIQEAMEIVSDEEEE